MPITRFLRAILLPEGSNPLKWKVMGILFISLFSTALTITMLFPFLPAMVKHFGKSEEEKGYYVGLIASSMFLGRCISSYIWGVFADKIGRRPIIIISLIATCLTTLGFGVSTSVPMAMAMRFLVGLLNGIIGNAKAVISELCDVTNQALGMSVITCAFTTGLMLGPALGGFLAETGTKYPETFPEGTFFYTYPFFLPCLLNSVLLAISSLFCYKWLPETMMKSKKNEKKSCCFKWRFDKNNDQANRIQSKSNKNNKSIGANVSLVKQDVDVTTQDDKSVKDGMETQSNLSPLKQETTDQNEFDHSSENGENKCQDSKMSTKQSDEESVKECKKQTNLCDKEEDRLEDEPKDENETSHERGSVVIVKIDKSEEIQTTQSRNDVNEHTGEKMVICREEEEEGCTIETVSECKKETHNASSEFDEGSHCYAESTKKPNTGTESDIPTVKFVCAKDGNATCEVTNESLTQNKDKNNEKVEDEGGGTSACCQCINKKGNLSRIFRNRNAVLVLTVYVMFGFSSVAIEELVHVWTTTEVRLGGLGFGTNDLATYLLIIGIVITILQPTVLPKIERKFGCIMSLQMALIIGLFFSINIPSLRIAYGRPEILWVCLLLCLGMRRLFVCATYLPIFLLLNNSVDRELLCSINGLGLTLSSLSKALGPTVAGAIYSWSLTTGRKIGFPFNLNMAFIFCGLVMLITVAVSCLISERLNEPKKIKIASDDMKDSVENLLEAKR